MEWTPQAVAAWWGATIATLALGWNIVAAVRAGARVKVFVVAHMRVYPTAPPTNDNEYIRVTAVNHGNAPTTITNCLGYYRVGKRSLFKRRKKQHFVVNTGLPGTLGMSVPYVLKPGEEWTGFSDQADILEKMQGGTLYLGIHHNQRKKSLLKRVRFRQPAV